MWQRMNITLQPRRFARRTDHISRGTITKDVPGPRYMEKGITPPTHPLRSSATLLPFDGCGPHGGRGSTSVRWRSPRLGLSQPHWGCFEACYSRMQSIHSPMPSYACQGALGALFRRPARQASKQRSLCSTITLRAAFDLVGWSGSTYQPSTSPADKAQWRFNITTNIVNRLDKT